MDRVLLRALATGLLGAIAGAVCLTLAFARDPGLALEMDRDLPRVTSGFYPVEITREGSFAWTGRSAAVRLQGADRSVPWTCAVRVRGGRSAPLEQPLVELAADGITLGSLTAANEYQTLDVAVPPRPERSGLVITIASSTTFVPGPGDTRELGVQVDRLACARTPGSLPAPPRRALTAAAASAGVFGGAFALLGAAPAAAVLGTVALAAAQAVPLSSGAAPYSAHPERALPLALWITLAALALTVALQARRPQRISSPARFAIAFSAAALFLELLAILHPSKLVVDAVLHAHRLEWVMGGRYYFTQPMPDGVQFPYAIGLYVFAWPWSVLTQDHVSLLRIVVLAVHTCAGALLYPVVARAWDDRAAGAIAVVLFHLVPLPYVVIGNANLTYAFGQSIAFITLAATAAWGLHPRQAAGMAALFVLAALAFLSHVGVFPVLWTTLVGAAVLYRTAGGAGLRPPARVVLAIATLAAVFSVAIYYGRFAEVYKSLDRVRARGAVAGSAAAPDASGRATIPVHERAGTAVALAVRAYGLPILLLAGAGALRAARTSGRDRLTLTLAAAGATYVVFVSFATWTPVEPRFQKYSDEFIDRVNYATIPLAAGFAARAAARGWSRGAAWRAAAAALLAAAGWIGVRAWLSWLA